jgi:hypothetical protein
MNLLRERKPSGVALKMLLKMLAMTNPSGWRSVDG